MMEEGCEHLEASPIGKCSICGKTVCSECYRTIFGEMICDEHEPLEDESAWELVGLYSDAGPLAEKRFQLEENGIVSIVVEEDEDAIELYVPGEEKDDGYAVLRSSGDESNLCVECRIQYSLEMEMCPICGKRPAESDTESSRIDD